VGGRDSNSDTRGGQGGTPSSAPRSQNPKPSSTCSHPLGFCNSQPSSPSCPPLGPKKPELLETCRLPPGAKHAETPQTSCLAPGPLDPKAAEPSGLRSRPLDAKLAETRCPKSSLLDSESPRHSLPLGRGTALGTSLSGFSTPLSSQSQPTKPSGFAPCPQHREFPQTSCFASSSQSREPAEPSGPPPRTGNAELAEASCLPPVGCKKGGLCQRKALLGQITPDFDNSDESHQFSKQWYARDEIQRNHLQEAGRQGRGGWV